MRHVPSAYRPQSDDTAEDIDRLLIEAYRRMSPAEKLERVAEICRAVDRLAIAGIRQRHPSADEREIRLRRAALRLDRAVMIELFAWDPVREGY
jgi:hypothetical protein